MAIKMDSLIKDAAQFNSRVDSLKKAGSERSQELHLLAVSALHHADEYGDTVFLSRLMDAFGPSENPQEFLYWVSVFGDNLIKWDKDTKSFKGNIRKDPETNEVISIKGNVSVTKIRAIKRKMVDGGLFEEIPVQAITCPWWDMPKIQRGREKIFDPAKDAKSIDGMIRRHAEMAAAAGEQELADAYLMVARSLVANVDDALSKARKRKAATENPVPSMPETPPDPASNVPVAEMASEDPDDNKGNK